jgi:hypothetical protein
MSGMFKGLRAHVFRRNYLAFCEKLTSNSLHLVGVKAVELRAEAVNSSISFTINVRDFLRIL